MNRSFSYLRISASLREYLWTSPGDRWLGMWQHAANSTPNSQITTLALEHRRLWRGNANTETVTSSSRHIVTFTTRW